VVANKTTHPSHSGLCCEDAQSEQPCCAVYEQDTVPEVTPVLGSAARCETEKGRRTALEIQWLAARSRGKM